MVDVDPVLCHCGKFVPVHRGVGARDGRPCLAWSSRFAGEVSGVELLKAASMSSRSNETRAAIRPSAINLDDAERLGTECFGPLVSTHEAVATQGESLAAGRNDGRHHLSHAEVGGRPHVYDLGIATAPKTGIHHATTIVNRDGVGHRFGHRDPVTAREVSLEAVVDSACRVFQPRRLTPELIEAGDCGFDVCLVEYLAATDQITVDRQKFDQSATRRRSPLAMSRAQRGSRLLRGC